MAPLRMRQSLSDFDDALAEEMDLERLRRERLRH